MARNRKRAKQRKAKRDASGGGEGIVRDDIPASLDHSSADVDEFEAKLVAGAEGTPADPKVDPSAGGVVHPEGLSAEEFAELEDRIDDVEAKIETGDQASISAAEESLEVDIEARQAAEALAPASADQPAHRKSIFGRFFDFLRASWSELQRVQWPDRRQVGQATSVVLGFVVIAGAYLGLADILAQKIVDLII